MNRGPGSDCEKSPRFVLELLPGIEQALRLHLPVAQTPGSAVFNEALRYAVFPGGKRFRAILAVLSSRLTNAAESHALAAAVAVEYLHTSAIVLDDLPAMDDACERRDRACLHLCFGEGLAIVVALALLNASYRIVSLASRRQAEAFAPALKELTDCIAAQIAGQAVDITCSSSSASGEWSHDEVVRSWKTSALLRLALTLGPILSGAPAAEVAALGEFGELLGAAYQHLDDSCDIEEDLCLLPRGHSASFAIQRGGGQARQRAIELIAEAHRSLAEAFGDRPAVSRLCEFAGSIVAPDGRL